MRAPWFFFVDISIYVLWLISRIHYRHFNFLFLHILLRFHHVFLLKSFLLDFFLLILLRNIHWIINLCIVFYFWLLLVILFIFLLIRCKFFVHKLRRLLVFWLIFQITSTYHLNYKQLLRVWILTMSLFFRCSHKEPIYFLWRRVR